MRTDLPCLPLIQERFWNAIKDELNDNEKKRHPDFEMIMFKQTWGSTALGFGGIGGQSLTTAYTTVVLDDYTGWCGVFFGEILAYKIKNPNQKFYEDMRNGQMVEVFKSVVYKKEEVNCYTCIDCVYFRWCNESGEAVCYNIGCDVSSDSSACDRFIENTDY